ncbi:hypothetical protein C0058_06695 [Pseudomonas sp. NC02]|nr:hypothetical protein C0058_06695 [Pseudomonas sp. NC02]
MLAKVVNDDAGILDKRGALRFFASKPAPTEKQICFRSGLCFFFLHSSRPGGRCALLLILICGPR